MNRVQRERIQSIQQTVLAWYECNRRDLPWRSTTDPYAILVSEVMLQQTQVNRVVPMYRVFLAEFPTVQSLAAAMPAAVIRAWKGLGYNRRALNLQKAAKEIVQRYGGVFPSTIDELRQLPGLGAYTAGAVATFAFGAVEPAVDVNVRRFIDHFLPKRTKRTEKDYMAAARSLVPEDRPREWLSTVMDYTSLVIRKNKISRSARNDKRKNTAEPFVGSNRYLRGQVIDRLRERAHTHQELVRRVANPVEAPREAFEKVLDGLVRDGMIDQRCDVFQLTGDS